MPQGPGARRPAPRPRAALGRADPAGRGARARRPRRGDRRRGRRPHPRHRRPRTRVDRLLHGGRRVHRPGGHPGGPQAAPGVGQRPELHDGHRRRDRQGRRHRDDGRHDRARSPSGRRGGAHRLHRLQPHRVARAEHGLPQPDRAAACSALPGRDRRRRPATDRDRTAGRPPPGGAGGHRLRPVGPPRARCGRPARARRRRLRGTRRGVRRAGRRGRTVRRGARGLHHRAHTRRPRGARGGGAPAGPAGGGHRHGHVDVGQRQPHRVARLVADDPHRLVRASRRHVVQPRLPHPARRACRAAGHPTHAAPLARDAVGDQHVRGVAGIADGPGDPRRAAQGADRARLQPGHLAARHRRPRGGPGGARRPDRARPVPQRDRRPRHPRVRLP